MMQPPSTQIVDTGREFSRAPFLPLSHEFSRTPGQVSLLLRQLAHLALPNLIAYAIWQLHKTLRMRDIRLKSSIRQCQEHKM